MSKEINLIFDFVLGERYGTITYYNTANEEIEKWTNRILKFGFKVSTPTYCIPAMIASYYRYFILDMAEESFFMVYPSAYVETMISYNV